MASPQPPSPAVFRPLAPAASPPPVPSPAAIPSPVPPTPGSTGLSRNGVGTVRAAAKAAAQAAVHGVYPTACRETRHAIEIAASAASAAAVATVRTAAPAAVSPSDAPSPPRANRRGDGSLRKPRQSLMIDEKLKLIEMEASGAYRT